MYEVFVNQFSDKFPNSKTKLTFAASRVRVRPRRQLPELRPGAGGGADGRVQAQLREVAEQRGKF